MKKLLVCFICVLFVCSCNNEKKQAELARQQAYEDSLAEAERIAEQKRIDSISSHVLGDVLFGMSLEEIRSTKLFSDCEFKETSWKNYDYYCQQKDFGSVYFDFENNRLVEVSLLSIIRGSVIREIDDIQAANKEIDRYKHLISQKYGEPTIEDRIPQKANFRPFFITIYYWSVYDKSISICIENDRSGRENCQLYVSCIIRRKVSYLLSEEEMDSIRKKEEEELELKRKKDSILINMF